MTSLYFNYISVLKFVLIISLSLGYALNSEKYIGSNVISFGIVK